MRFAHWTVATRDLDASRRFYEEALGWAPIDRPGNIPMRAAWLRIADGQELHLLEIAGHEPSRSDDEYGRHVAFAMPARELDLLRGRLVALGIEIVDPSRPTPVRRFFVRDPGGYVVELVADPEP